MSLFRPDGTYYGPVPPWFTPPAGDGRFGQATVRVNPRFDRAMETFSPISQISVQAITFRIGRYTNGNPKWMFLTQADLDAFEEQRALEERW